MPLLDHFHPPLSVVRHWEAFHARWAAAIADALNRELLPADYFAEARVHVGSRVEVDVAAFGESLPPSQMARRGGTATLPTPVWTPPAPAFSVPAIFPDSLEILVFGNQAGPTLVAAVKLVSPGNKDREAFRRAFAAKCASYLQQGVGLAVIDIVTNRQANLQNELVQSMDAGNEFLVAAEPLYAASYRPIRRTEGDRIDVWPATLTVGQLMPVMPLPLDKGVCVPLDLEATYSEACERSRLP